MQTPHGMTGTLLKVATLTFCVAALHFGKPVLIPLAVATLLAFLLTPVVNALGRKKLRLPLAVSAVVLVSFLIFGGVLWGFGTQLRALAFELPDYKQNLVEKIADLRAASKGPALDRVRQTWRELRGELHRPANATT